MSEWHNANFEDIWAKRKTNAYRRKSRSSGFIVDDEDGDTALKKAIKKRKNKPSMWFENPIEGKRLTLLQLGFYTRSRFECCLNIYRQLCVELPSPVVPRHRRRGSPNS